jgi:hypothetical protein
MTESSKPGLSTHHGLTTEERTRRGICDAMLRLSNRSWASQSGRLRQCLPL